MIFNNYLIGIIEDNTWVFYLSYLIKGLRGCTSYVGYPTGSCISINEPFSQFSAYFITRIFSPVFGYNLIILGGFALNFFFAFWFFKKLFKPFTALLLSTVFFVSPYFAYQSRSHIDLLQFWPVVWFLGTLFFSKSRYKGVYLGLLLALITSFSNYLGYFTILFTFLYLVFGFLLDKSKIHSFKKYYSSVLVGAAVFVLISMTFLWPYIKSNYLVPRVPIGDKTVAKVVNKPLEDFVIFSSRPWYYLMPSVDNPFFGGTSQGFLTKISSGGNYLTANYFKSEHSASFLGWVNMCLAVAGLISLAVSFKTRRDSESRSPISYLVLSLSIIGLVILSMPPYVSVSGISFYTPSFLLFKAFPMFRVLARLGVLILFLMLIFTGYGYELILRSAGSRRSTRFLSYILIIFLVVFSLAESFITIKITNVSASPKVYTYIGDTVLQKSPIVVYPYSKTTDAVFWISTYKQPLINPRFYEDTKTGFIAEDFTKNLNTTNGLNKAREMGAKYMVYFYEEDGNSAAGVFNGYPYFTKVEQFTENSPDEQQTKLGNYVLAKISDLGSGRSNSAILYSFK